MKKAQSKKKAWSKPKVKTLNIKKDTFSGSHATGAEDAYSKTPTGPWTR